MVQSFSKEQFDKVARIVLFPVKGYPTRGSYFILQNGDILESKRGHIADIVKMYEELEGTKRAWQTAMQGVSSADQLYAQFSKESGLVRVFGYDRETSVSFYKMTWEQLKTLEKEYGYTDMGWEDMDGRYGRGIEDLKKYIEEENLLESVLSIKQAVKSILEQKGIRYLQLRELTSADDVYHMLERYGYKSERDFRKDFKYTFPAELVGCWYFTDKEGGEEIVADTAEREIVHDIILPCSFVNLIIRKKSAFAYKKGSIAWMSKAEFNRL